MMSALPVRDQPQPTFWRWSIAGVMLAEAATFFTAASLHLGAQIRLGFTTLTEPPILPAARVELVCGLALLGAGVALLSRARVGWLLALAAHLLSMGGVLLGMVALAAGRGPRTASNDMYHFIILMVMLAVAALLATPAARAALRR